MLKLNLLSRIVGLYRGMFLFLLLLSLLLLLALSALREGGSSSLTDFSLSALLLCSTKANYKINKPLWPCCCYTWYKVVHPDSIQSKENTCFTLRFSPHGHHQSSACLFGGPAGVRSARGEVDGKRLLKQSRILPTDPRRNWFITQGEAAVPGNTQCEAAGLVR